MEGERSTGSWTTDADGSKPGDPPAGWNGDGGDPKRKQTRTLGDVGGKEGEPGESGRATPTGPPHQRAPVPT